VFPSKKNLATHPDVLAKPALQILAKNITRYIWPGPYPATYDTALNVIIQNALYNDMPIKEAVAEGQRQMDQELPPTGFVSVESEYGFFAEHK
jgi:multiple sugar transport system substrate-binding protein